LRSRRPRSASPIGRVTERRCMGRSSSHRTSARFGSQRSYIVRCIPTGR
jgi:hypothetical protein